jgi:hypothetical protein
MQPLSDSSYEEDPNWKHLYEGMAPVMPSNDEKIDDHDDNDDEAEDEDEHKEEDEEEDEGDISSRRPKKHAQEQDGG